MEMFKTDKMIKVFEV